MRGEPRLQFCVEASEEFRMQPSIHDDATVSFVDLDDVICCAVARETV